MRNWLCRFNAFTTYTTVFFGNKQTLSGFTKSLLLSTALDWKQHSNWRRKLCKSFPTYWLLNTLWFIHTFCSFIATFYNYFEWRGTYVNNSRCHNVILRNNLLMKCNYLVVHEWVVLSTISDHDKRIIIVSYIHVSNMKCVQWIIWRLTQFLCPYFCIWLMGEWMVT